MIKTAEVEGVTAATFGKFLVQHSVFMWLRGVAYSKKHTGAGQVVAFERVISEGGVKAMKVVVRYRGQLLLSSWLSSVKSFRGIHKACLILSFRAVLRP